MSNSKTWYNTYYQNGLRVDVDMNHLHYTCFLGFSFLEMFVPKIICQHGVQTCASNSLCVSVSTSQLFRRLDCCKVSINVIRCYLNSLESVLRVDIVHGAEWTTIGTWIDTWTQILWCSTNVQTLVAIHT